MLPVWFASVLLFLKQYAEINNYTRGFAPEFLHVQATALTLNTAAILRDVKLDKLYISLQLIVAVNNIALTAF